MAKPRALISLCCCGIPCRYHGMTHKMGRRLYKEGLVARLREKYELVPVCPEIMGGLPTPRPPCFTTWEGESLVVEQRGLEDGSRIFWTAEYVRGAEWVVWLAEEWGVEKAFLLRKSPACDPQNGVAGRALRRAGISVTGI